ncbi:hypothetical protein MANES_10G090601v8 [Manihot esculenta]|uniref:Uncharacterized protein n=1 Tax=Manihot esculenta TaxID=3983 RepID=A0ACB7GZE4_MANES|nr:hypothetical protein MANES_10G090601v8 [Manihot esculenta]
MESSAEAIQRIARISAHLLPPNFQMEGSFVLKGGDCMAKRRTPGLKVTILGTTEGIGQPLAMLVKMNPLFSFLHLYDVVNAPRVTTDISRMNTSADISSMNTIAVVRNFLGQPQLGKALKGMNLVIIPTGVPKKLGMIRDDLFNINVGIVTTLKGIAKCCPMEIVNLISNIVNSVVSIATEVFMKAGTYDPKQLMGITMLDVAEVLGLHPREVDVPVVGGHARVTILPLLSQCCCLITGACAVKCLLKPEETEYLTKRSQDGGTEVVQAKAGTGSATLSMAYAALTELPFFATKVRLGRNGAEEIYQLGPINEYERIGVEKAKKELEASI